MRRAWLTPITLRTKPRPKYLSSKDHSSTTPCSEIIADQSVINYQFIFFTFLNIKIWLIPLSFLKGIKKKNLLKILKVTFRDFFDIYIFYTENCDQYFRHEPL